VLVWGGWGVRGREMRLGVAGSGKQHVHQSRAPAFVASANFRTAWKGGGQFLQSA
jgi:hypothetical protein